MDEARDHLQPGLSRKERPPRLETADVGLLIASPVYWFTMSAQAKLFMDRLYVFGARSYRELKGERVGVILASWRRPI